MKKLLMALLFLAAFYLTCAAVEWNFNPAAWLRLTRLAGLAGAGLFMLSYPYEKRK